MRIGVLLLVTLAAACAKAPPRVAPLATMPFSVDSSVTTVIAPGVVYRSIRSAEGPWAIEVLDVRLDRCVSLRAVKGFPGADGREKTSVLLKRLDDTTRVLGGVNADFFLFDPPGRPTNALVIDGRVFAGPTRRPLLVIDSTGAARITVLFDRGDTTRFIATDRASDGHRFWPIHPQQAVGGRPMIVRDGQLTREATDTVTFAITRHPRTAAGIASDGHRLLLLVVDGRQEGWSAGMRLDELGRLMIALGVRDAINLDGGGSTTLVVRDPAGDSLRIANRPSDKTGERPVGDAVAVIDRCVARR